jgi:hypothetical protein
MCMMMEWDELMYGDYIYVCMGIICMYGDYIRKIIYV